MPPVPLFFRNLFLMLLYLHASDKRGRGGEDENPVAVQLMPPDQSHARLLEVHGLILIYAVPALTECYHTPHPSLPFRLVTLDTCPFIYYDPYIVPLIIHHLSVPNAPSVIIPPV